MSQPRTGYKKKYLDRKLRPQDGAGVLAGGRQVATRGRKSPPGPEGLPFVACVSMSEVRVLVDSTRSETRGQWEVFCLRLEDAILFIVNPSVCRPRPIFSSLFLLLSLFLARAYVCLWQLFIILFLQKYKLILTHVFTNRFLHGFKLNKFSLCDPSSLNNYIVKRRGKEWRSSLKEIYQRTLMAASGSLSVCG